MRFVIFMFSFFASVAQAQTPPPVIHPSSNGSNFQGAGWPTTGQAVYSNANVLFWADQFMMQSDDPSANFSLTLSGPLTLNDVIHLHFMWGSTDAVIDYQITATDVASGSAIQVLNNIGAAIHQDARLWNLPDGVTNLYGGGYANGAILGLMVLQNPNWLQFDYDSRIAPLSIKYTVTGAGTEVITVYPGLYNGVPTTGGSAQNVAYQVPNSLDGNPGFVTTRFIDGVVPPRGSLISGWSVVSNNSALPHGLGLGYGSIVYVLYNSTSGSEAGVWWLQGMNAGASGFGVRIGSGIFAAYGEGLPNDGTGLVDKGGGSANFNEYWLSNVYKMSKVGAALQIDTGTDLIKSSGGIQAGLGTTYAQVRPASGGGTDAAFVAYAPVPGYTWVKSDGDPNNNEWDAISTGSDWMLRAAKTNSAAVEAIHAHRTGQVIDYVNLLGTVLQVNGVAGLSVTKTVRNAANIGSCTLVFTKGLLTGGTC